MVSLKNFKGGGSYGNSKFFIQRGLNVREGRDIFYFQRFYDLLYEKLEQTDQSGSNPPEYFKSEKYYTMGPGIDFPLVMAYKEAEYPNFDPYFYFLNGHGDVTYFADANFTEDLVESYEYNPWGSLITSFNKNNLLYTSREFDFETGLQFNRMRYYRPSLGRFCQKDFLYYKMSNFFLYVYNIPTEFADPLGLLPPGHGGGGIAGMLPGPNLGPLEDVNECLRRLCEDCGGCWSETGSFWHCDKCPGQGSGEYLLIMTCYEFLAWLCIPSGPF